MARILIAEDEPHIVRVLALWLRRHGHEIVEVRNGREALEHLTHNRVDLLITDVNMPGMDGLELVRSLRQDRALTLPVLMLSARCDQTSLAQRAAAHGVQLFPKPFVPSQIVEEINRLLEEAAVS